MEEEQQQKPQAEIHIVMFPWLAYGHILPFIEFSKSLATRGLKITIVSTHLNILWINQQLSQSQPVTGVYLVELELPSVEGLPAGVESTAHVMNGGAVPLLIEALDRCEAPFEALLRRLSPDFVIHDLPQYWTPRVAAKLGIPAIYFCVVSAASINFWARREAAEDMVRPLSGFPSSIIRHRLFEVRKFFPFFEKNKDGIRFVDRLTICVDQSWAIAINTCTELEGTYIEYGQRVSGRPVFPVGILMPQIPPRPEDDPCLEWLDRQAPRSVVVVSFGSECPLTSEEIVALALGLEEIFMPFIFVLRGNTNGRAALPEGFCDRTQRRGLVVTGWVPQLHILSHPSTGAFVTHCGWNSVLEGVRFGVPLVALPMQFEQGVTARLIADEVEVGVEVQRNEEDGRFGKEDISKAVRAVMVEERGERIKANVARLSEALCGNNFQVHRSNMDNFIAMLEKEAMKNNP